MPAQRRWEKSLVASENRQWFPSDDLIVRHALDENTTLLVNETPRPTQPDEPTEADVSPPKDEKKVEIGFKDGLPAIRDLPSWARALPSTANFRSTQAKRPAFDYRDRVHDFKDRFAISAWFYPESESSGAIVTRMSDSVTEQENNLPKGRGYGVFFVNGKVHFNLVGVWADDSFRVETENTLPVKTWHHLLAVFDSLQPYDKVQIYVNGQKQSLKVNNSRLFRQFANNDAHLRIGGGGGPQWRFKGLMDEVRIYKALPSAEQIAILSCPDSLSRIAAIAPQMRSEAQRLKIRNAFLDEAASTATAREWKTLRELQRQKASLEASIVTLMVMQELPQPRPAFVLNRGAYDAKGASVDRGVPAVLPALPKLWPNNRLGLARWLVSTENPLTARVTVNRFWQMFFSNGLVKTAEDFGAQGERPSHPELLDWLAVEFHQSGWNIKALLKTIVMSNTYRQNSKITPELLQRDPENRLLARGPRVRLPAEMIRDQALFASGLLVEELGGPSVRPYQPEGLYKDLLFSNMTKYAQDKSQGFVAAESLHLLEAHRQSTGNERL